STLYLSPETLIHKRKVALELDELFNERITENISSIKTIKSLLETQNTNINVYNNHVKSYSKDWNDNLLFIEYELIEENNVSPVNLQEIENKFCNKVGLETGLFNIEFTPSKKELI